MMADEPTGALDSKNARLLLESFENMNQNYGATVLMVTHDSFAASYPRREFFDRIMEVVAMMGGEGSDAL